MEKKEGEGALVATQEWLRCLLLSSPSQTLRLTPLTSALRAARAHDAVLRMYPDLPLRFIKIHGDILVSYAYALINFTSTTDYRAYYNKINAYA